jgi:hypothetical protein
MEPRNLSWVYNSEEFSEFEHQEVLHISELSFKSDSVKTCMFPALCMELCTQTSQFHCKQHPCRTACLHRYIQATGYCMCLIQRSWLRKGTLITMVWLVLRKHVACMRYMNLGACVEAFSALSGTYLSSSSYVPRLACASLCFNKR